MRNRRIQPNMSGKRKIKISTHRSRRFNPNVRTKARSHARR